MSRSAAIGYAARVAAAAFVLAAAAATAQEVDAGAAAEEEGAPPGPEIGDITELSLEDLLNTETSVATRSVTRTVRETPGVVTVLTREEIRRSGARDLVDVLNLIPAFQFGTDTYSTVYAGVRGLWAADGKLLVLLDGHEMQDLLYNTTVLGNRFPVDWIERVEIIRGPGSAIYGGSSELAVVNVVTRAPADVQGVAVHGTYGQMLDGVANGGQSLGETFSQRYVSLTAGGASADGRYTGLVSVFAGQGNRSDRVYTDVYGTSYNMAGDASADPLLAHLRFSVGDLQVSALLERYHTTMRDGYDAALERPLPVNFYASSLIASYDWRLGEGFTLTPKLRWAYQRPWVTTDPYALEFEEPYYWDPSLHRVNAGLAASWDAAGWLNVLVGAEYTFDHAEDDFYGFAPDTCEVVGNRPGSDPDCMDSMDYNNVALYAQGLAVTRFVDVSAGARFEYHDQFGASFVPRGALTKAFGPFHFKALAAQAFRVPSIQNLAYSPDVKPEKASVFELELGYKLTDWLFVVANGFFGFVQDPLVYYYDEEVENEGYRNYKKTGTAGAEAELKAKRGGHFASLRYGFYHPAGQNDIETYAVPGHDDVLLGFAQHKLTLNGGVEIARDLTFNVSAYLLLGDRYGYRGLDADGEAPVLASFAPEVVLNANLMYRDLFAEGLYVQVGARNMANSEIWYVQPYDNWHAPMPGSSAEVFVKLGYESN